MVILWDCQQNNCVQATISPNLASILLYEPDKK